ncbi:hypothetical protein SBA4_1630007 [Candidatus Sulfopaludibacter sp. SbA4]|nr:hypothetical protein SBA4_1630007 [Candidatus Sulfopaludibacter sp. SbA4]
MITQPRLVGFELYFEDLEAAKVFYRDTLGLEMLDEQAGHHARFAAGATFLCLERKGVESYPSRDKAVLFVEVPDLEAMVEKLGEKRIVHWERPRWAVFHDPEGHNVLLMQAGVDRRD